MVSSAQITVVVCLLMGAALAASVGKKDTPVEVSIHATNKTQTPSVHYIVDAVELLREAYSIYADDIQRIQMYAELYTEKHPETQWNVVAGYTAAYLKAQWYVETEVTGGGKDKSDSKVSPKYLIFSVA